MDINLRAMASMQAEKHESRCAQPAAPADAAFGGVAEAQAVGRYCFIFGVSG